MNAFSHPDFELVDAPADEAARVAAEVAARYGVALPEGGVALRRAPTGARATFVYPVWDAGKKQLQYPDEVSAKMRASMGVRASHFAADKRRDLGQRNAARVAELRAQNLTVPEIAAACGLAAASVYTHLKALGLAPLTPHEAARLRFMALVSAGHDAGAIMAMTGRSLEWVVMVAAEKGVMVRGLAELRSAAGQARRAREAGGDARLGKAGRRRAAAGVARVRGPRLAERREAIIARLQDVPRPTVRVLAAEFGCSVAAINSMLARIYNDRPDLRCGSRQEQSILARVSAVAARREGLAGVLAEAPGLPQADLAARLGYDIRSLQKDLLALRRDPATADVVAVHDAARKARARPIPEVEARRARITALLQRDPRPTRREMAAVEGVPLHVLDHDLSAIYAARPDLKPAPDAARPRPAEAVAAQAARRDRLAKMLAENPALTQREIAAIQRCSLATVCADMTAIGFVGPKSRGRR